MNRKDPKGRVLRKGEGYRKDKNLYIYQYRDPLGGMHTLYANNIIDLREKEDEITRDRLDGIQIYVAGSTTLNEAYDRYISLKYDVNRILRLITIICTIISSGIQSGEGS